MKFCQSMITPGIFAINRRNNKMSVKTSVMTAAVAAMAVSGASAATVGVGTVIGVDFRGSGPTDGSNFNVFSADGTLEDIIDTSGATLTDVDVSAAGQLVYNDNAADSTQKSGQPSQFTDAHLTDWVVFAEGVDYTITFVGLDPTLTYDLVIGGANDSNFNVDTTWTADGVSATTVAGTKAATDGSGAYVTLTGLQTDGLGTLVIIGESNESEAGTEFGVVSALELTAVPEPGSLALIALGGMLVARRRRD